MCFNMGKHNLEVKFSENSPKTSGITPIDKDVVHKICSGQVVLTLAVAVKELLENSLDAGATAIDIRLVDQGSTIVEVADNGSGIKEDDFEGIALKHHTSKLSSFNDLESVGTFGFRGEALSSLCSLCGGLSVLTCHSSATCATSLQFDNKGILTKKTPCARQVGTTVSLQSLFSGLPVRRKEFLRNLQREFVKMTHLLYAYCLVSTGVRITCVNRNQQKGAHSNVIVATQGGVAVRDNIACVFGQKQLMTLRDFKQKEAPDEILEEFGLKTKKCVNDITKEEKNDSTLEDERIEEIAVRTSPYNITGCISTCEHGKGRGVPDRQFFFINARPCEPTKVIRLINEVYHQFNSHQNPFVFMDIRTDGTDGCGVDVNVTPDKRKIFIENEKLLLATIKASLLEMYSSTPRTFQLQNLPSSFLEKSQTNINSETEQIPSGSSRNSFQTSPSLKSLNSSTAGLPISQVLSRFAQYSCSSSPTETQFNISKRKSDNESETKNKKHRIDEFYTSKSEISNPIGYENVAIEKHKIIDSHEPFEVLATEVDTDIICLEDNKGEKNDNKTHRLSQEESESEITVTLSDDSIKTSGMDILASGSSDLSCGLTYILGDTKELTFVNDVNRHKKISTGNSEPDSANKSAIIQGMVRSFSLKAAHSSEGDKKDVSFELSEPIVCEESEIVIVDEEVVDGSELKVITVDLSMADIASKLRRKEEKKKRNQMKLELERKARFSAAINPKENKNAEMELQREITKEMFSKMKVIGQFNLGFIVTQLGSDLFIIDQHASDEKYNFETLQLTTNLQQQPLVVPQHLDFTAASKAILLENLEVFERNGFKFSFSCDDKSGSAGVCLTSIPLSQNWTFGKEDVDELIFMLQDSPHTNCRPSRVRDMFASRACRKSVMIGTALSTIEMHRLVEHMGQIEQPWNCPHGRPTMRHLINLDLII